MKWIKASERLPNEWNSRTIVRFSHTKLVLHEVRDFLERYPHRLGTLEWLDESSEGEDARREEDAILFAEWCGENSVGYEECVWFYKDKTGRYNYSTEKMWALFNQSITRKP